MLTEITANGTKITLDHTDKSFQEFEATNNILRGNYAATGGTGRQHFWIDKETLRAYVPTAISFE